MAKAAQQRPAAPEYEPNSTGLMTRPKQALAPAALAEQQRAITEIQASLQVAKAFPRDEKEALDRILLSCQRVGVAEEATYSYSKGGTEITGPSIKLLEVVAQHWGNIDFGFREIGRFRATPGQPGESIVEAFAWDLQNNVRRKAQFSVPHEIKAYDRMKPLVDERDIYEWMANNAQRRVRTCLENIIPRDIVDAALDQCAKTLKEKAPVTPEGIAKLMEAFAKQGVTKEQIEARLQRRIDTMTPAQMAAMRRIWKSIDEGVSKSADWFKSEQPPEQPTADGKSKADRMADEMAGGLTLLEKTRRQMAIATADEAGRLYDMLVGPESTVEWTQEEAKLIGDWRDARVADLAGGKPTGQATELKMP